MKYTGGSGRFGSEIQNTISLEQPYIICFKNISDNNDEQYDSYELFGRQPPVRFDSLPCNMMHEPLPDDVPVVHPACTTSSNENLPKNNSESQNVTLRLPLQPVEPSNEQL